MMDLSLYVCLFSICVCLYMLHVVDRGQHEMSPLFCKTGSLLDIILIGWLEWLGLPVSICDKGCTPVFFVWCLRSKLTHHDCIARTSLTELLPHFLFHFLNIETLSNVDYSRFLIYWRGKL